MSLQDSKIGFISLGCPKALVDSERILTQLRSEGYQIVPTYNKADLVIVNTCGFIDSAVEESMDAIQEAMAENGKVIVTGCLGVKKDLLQQRFPSLLSISGPQDYESVMKAVHHQLPQKHDPFTSLVPPQGIKLTPKHYAYLKISEGCNHRCSFCIIPSMRGNLVSRSVADIMREAEQLAKSGVRELLVISQDTSAYGVDIKYAQSLWKDKSIRAHITDLANALSELGIWIRFHYVYPYPHVNSLIELMAEGKILPYIDVPFQHASPRVLKAMKRPANSEKTLETVLQWRKICPELTIRSTFIVGFPGETQEDFEELLDFIDEAELDRVGCFKYSPVEGAKANELANPVPEEVKEERWQEFMALQAEISAERLHNKIGTQQIVLIDEVTAEGAIARSTADAPEIDGVVVIENGQNLKVGEFATVTIVDANEYDLFAEFSTGSNN